MKKASKNTWSNFIILIIILTSAVLFLIPVLLTVFKSFSNDGNISLHGYYELFFNCFSFYRMFWNSVLYTSLITIGIFVVCIPAAFSFKFAQFKGKNILFVLYVIVMMMPLQVTLLPNYIGLRDMGILNTHAAIILPMIFSPFGTVVIYQYMREIDGSVIEAGRIETNSVVKIIMHCVLPQIKICIMAAALFVFADMWNMVEQPLFYVNDDNLRTLSTFISQIGEYDKSVLLPASVIFVIPVILCYLLFHEELQQGLKL